MRRAASLPSSSRASLAALVLLLTSCLSPTPFQPAGRDGANGYTVERIEQDRFRIGFAGNSATSPQQVKNSLAYLAAQVTLRNGGNYFRVASNKLDEFSVYHPLGSRAEYASIPCCRTRGMTTREYAGTAEIVIFKGRAPLNDPSAYDARSVVEDLEPRIKRGSRFSVY